MFISGEDAARAPEAGSQDSQLQGNFLDILGNVATTFINTKVPGLGPMINPGMYQNQQTNTGGQTAAQQQQAAAQIQAAGKKSGTPSWVLPASIAGGVGVLVLIIVLATRSGRASNPVKYKSARDLAGAFGTRGYYTDSRGYVGVRSKGWVNWFRWNAASGSYRMVGSTRDSQGAEYRKVA